MRLASVEMPLSPAVSSGIMHDQTLTRFSRVYIDRVRHLIDGEPDEAIAVLGLEGAHCRLHENDHACHVCKSALRIVCRK